jgi:hypothetical protein
VSDEFHVTSGPVPVIIIFKIFEHLQNIKNQVSMKKLIVLIYFSFFLAFALSGQKYESLTVKAGRKIKDYYPYSERYMYPQFVQGKVILKNGNSNSALLNYDLLLGEIAFLKGSDTLIINRKSDLNSVIIQQDTFIYRNSYYRSIHSGKLNVFSRDRIKCIEIVKQGVMGTSNRSSAGESYSSIPMDGKFVNLVATDDIVLKRDVEFYILPSNNELVAFKKKNVIELYLNKKAEIDKYLKSNKVNFDSQTDILRFSEWLELFPNKI